MDAMEVWLLTGSVEELRNATEVAPGELVVQDRGAVLAVGRASDELDVDWTHELDADLLPEHYLVEQQHQRPGPIHRIEQAPSLFVALSRLEESAQLRGA